MGVAVGPAGRQVKKLRKRSSRRAHILAGVAATALVAAAAPVITPQARADVVAYLVNVTVRPGYHFANAEEAISYGNGICSKVRAGQPYSRLIADIKADQHTSDEFQASYLVTQAVNELCPELIWNLRRSAAGYRPTG
jgi:hypothetical protein